MERHHYIIRGGAAGRERLKVLSRVFGPTTLNLLNRVGIQPGMKCLERLRKRRSDLRFGREPDCERSSEERLRFSEVALETRHIRHQKQ